MATQKRHIVQEWEVDVTVQATLTLPLEEGEDEDEFNAWLKDSEGERTILDKVQRQVNRKKSGVYGTGVVLVIDEIRLKETEVGNSDFDPRL